MIHLISWLTLIPLFFGNPFFLSNPHDSPSPFHAIDAPFISPYTLPTDTSQPEIKVINLVKTPYCACNQLPKKVNESSGLQWIANGWWTHTDSQGKPEIYALDSSGCNIIKTIRFKEAVNNDWEDITIDDNYIYIGDFGNNLGKRKDLTIYRIRKEAVDSKSSLEVSSEKIGFKWDDQTDFSPRDRKQNFDCESMFSAGGRLWFFSKDWGDNQTRLYCLNEWKDGESLKPIQKIDIGGLVTGADYSAKDNLLALIGYDFYAPVIWLIPGFDPNQPSIKYIVRINLVTLFGAQTEGIAFRPDGKLFFSCEETPIIKASLFSLNPKEFLPELKINAQDTTLPFIVSTIRIGDKNEGEVAIEGKNQRSFSASLLNRKGERLAKGSTKTGKLKLVISEKESSGKLLLVKIEENDKVYYIKVTRFQN